MPSQFGGVPVEEEPTSKYGGVRVPDLRRYGGEGVTVASPRATLSQFLSGFNERLAGMLSAPQEALDEQERLIEKVRAEYEARTGRTLIRLPRPPDPVAMTGQSIADVIETYTIGAAPTTTTGRIARRAGEEVAATLPIAGTAFAAAPAAAGIEATTAIRGAARAIGRGITAGPGRAAAAELAAATGAGVGGGIAQQMAPGNAYAEIVGQLAGGFSPALFAYTPTSLSIRLSRALMHRLSPSSLTQAARQEVATAIGPLSPRETASLERATALQSEIPGFEPSLAEATGSPGLLATQRMVEGRAQGVDLEQLVARRQGNVEAISSFASSRAPDVPGSPSYVVDVAQGRVRDIRADLEAQRAEVSGQQMALAEELPRADRYELGMGLRSRLNEIRIETRNKLDQRAEELGLNNFDLTVHFDDLRASILGDFRTKYLFDETPPEVVALVDSVPERLEARARAQGEGLGLEGEELASYIEQNSLFTFGDLKSLRERVSDDLIDALSNTDAGARARVRTLTLLKARIDDFIDAPDGFQAILPPEFAQNWQTFRREYFNQYIEPFERGASYQVRQKDGRGFYRTRDENVAAAFFAPGNVSAAKQFRAAFGNDPAANDAIASAALDSLRDYAVRDGVLVTSRFNTWLRNHDSVLSEFPAIQSAIGNVRSAFQGLSARQMQLDLRLKQVNDSILARRLQAVGRGTQTPEQLIDAALKEPRMMQSLVASLREDAGAMESLRRHVWDLAADMTPEGLARFLDGRSQSLARLFDARHLSDLQRIQEARAMINQIEAPRGQGVQPDPTGALARRLGSGVPQIASRIFAAESGRTSYRFVMSDMFARYVRGRSIVESETLLREALYNPEVAKDLAGMIDVSAVGAETTRRLNAWLFNIGLGDRGMMEERQNGN